MRKVVGLVLLALASPALAQSPTTAETHRTKGEAHAKRGEYAEAIAEFKKADGVEPAAKHACMIGLTYLRRNFYGQAELFLKRCRSRARPGEALPSWVPAAEKQLADGLAKDGVSAIEIVVMPATAAASVKITGFAPDETFDPQTIHLPAGTYTITVSAPGYPDATREVTAKGTRDTQRVEIVLEQKAAPVEPTPPVAPVISVSSTVEPAPLRANPEVAPAGGVSTLGVGLVAAGAAAAGAGVTFHLLALGYKDDLNEARDNSDLDAYNLAEEKFNPRRNVAYIGYGVGAVALGAGLYFLLRKPASSTQISAIPVEGGGVFTVGWQR